VLPYKIIMYEAPHRLNRTLKDIFEVLGDRETAVARELTKLHQTVHRGKLSELVEKFTITPPKGECCILLAPYEEKTEEGDSSDWLSDLKKYESEGVNSKDAMKIVAKKYGISKRDIYKARITEDEIE